MKWKQLFKPHILERGMEYYYAGCVESLEADDEQITAVVEGTEDYDVLIELDRGKVLDMECTCPYAEGGERGAGSLCPVEGLCGRRGRKSGAAHADESFVAGRQGAAPLFGRGPAGTFAGAGAAGQRHGGRHRGSLHGGRLYRLLRGQRLHRRAGRHPHE